MNIETVSVVGLGYIGLPTASLIATKGIKVYGLDVSAKAVETINAGNIHFHEPDLAKVVSDAVNCGNLRASTEAQAADVFIIAVPTPLTDEDEPDVSYVEAAARSIAPVLQPGNLVVVESTIPIGTTEQVCGWIGEERPDLAVPSWGGTTAAGDSDQVYVAHCPERVLPGQILKELVENDRVVGGVDLASTEAALALYRVFTEGRILPTDCRTAELCKLCENAFRDVNIAFANELSLICSKFDVNVWDLIALANRHPRVNILRPGPGVGGHCIAIDPWFIVSSAPEQAKLIRQAREVNDAKPGHVIAEVKEKASRLKDPVIACLGLAFKADVDDLRESPAIEVTQRLAEEKIGTILAVEPHVDELPASLTSLGVEMASIAEAIERADIALLLVDHKAFSYVDRSSWREKVVIDTRGVWR